MNEAGHAAVQGTTSYIVHSTYIGTSTRYEALSTETLTLLHEVRRVYITHYGPMYIVLCTRYIVRGTSYEVRGTSTRYHVPRK